MEKIEIRSISSLSVNEDTYAVEGLVNKTNEWSKVLGNRNKFRERIVQGAFDKAIKMAEKIDFLSEHNKNLLLSSTENGSLDLYEDEEGLQMRAMIAPTSYGKDIHTLIRTKMMNHMSFGFKVLKDSWEKGTDGISLRTIEELILTEVSAVRNPCYIQSAIEARGIEIIEDVEIREEKIDMENLKAKLKAELLKDLKEKRSMNNLQQTTGIGTDRGILKDGVKVDSGFTKGIALIEPTSSIVDKCLNVTSDSNTGISIIPIIDETGINYVEVRAEGLEKELIIAQEVFNSLTEEDIKIQLDIMVNLEKENRLALELEKIESTGSKLTDLFTIDTRFVGDNYIMCNQANLTKISSLTLGSEMALEYKRIDGVLVPVINEVPVIINENVTKVVLFTPKHIGISNLALDETGEIITTTLRRNAKKMWRRFTGVGIKVLIKDSIRAITLA